GTLKLSEFQSAKELETRKVLASQLESSADPNAVLLFFNIENEILQDDVIIDYFSNPLANHAMLINRLSQLYMAGYLSRYDFTAYEFNEKDEPVHENQTVSLNAYKSLVIKGSV